MTPREKIEDCAAISGVTVEFDDFGRVWVQLPNGWKTGFQDYKEAFDTLHFVSVYATAMGISKEESAK